MAVVIRMSRKGAKKHPFYHIVVANSRNARDGSYIEKVGTYDPMVAKETPNRIVLNAERIKYWLGVGAQASDRVARFISDAGIGDKYTVRTNQPKKSAPKAKAQERVKALAAKKQEAEAAAKAAKEAEEKAFEEPAKAEPAPEAVPAAAPEPAPEAPAAEEAPAA